MSVNVWCIAVDSFGFVSIYKTWCMTFTAVAGYVHDLSNELSSGSTAVYIARVRLPQLVARNPGCCCSDWLSGVLFGQLGFRLVDCLHRLLGEALLLAHRQKNWKTEEERRRVAMRRKKKKVRKERGGGMVRRWGEEKKRNISLNESLLGVSVSQVDGVGVFASGSPSFLSTLPPPSACVCVFAKEGVSGRWGQPWRENIRLLASRRYTSQ